MSPPGPHGGARRPADQKPHQRLPLADRQRQPSHLVLRTSRQPLPRERTKPPRRPSGSAPLAALTRLLRGLQARAAPPSPGPLAGLQLRAERSRLGSSSSMALLPHYPDVGPSPPRLYRLSAGSARVMRALLITIAETPLTLTAPSEERQHLLCAGRRPSPAPRSPSLAAPSFRVLSPDPPLHPLCPSTLPFVSPPFSCPPHHPTCQGFSTSASQDERDPRRDRAPEILRDGDTQRARARVPRHPKLWITEI